MVYWVIPMKGANMHGIGAVLGSGEPKTHDMVKAMLVFSNKNIVLEGNEVDTAMEILLRDFEIKTKSLNDDFMSINMVDKHRNRELTIGVATKKYGLIDIADIYEIYDQIKAEGFIPKKMYIWRWRRYRIYFEHEKYKNIKIAWDDKYGHHEDTYSVSIYLENTYDRGGSFKIGTFVIRQVCQNGLFGRSEISVSVRHYMKAENQINKIVEAIPKLINSSMNTIRKYAQVFIDDKFMEIIKKHIGKKVTEEAIKNINRHDNPAQYHAIGKINYYDFVQGLTYEYTHKREVSENTLIQLRDKIEKAYKEYMGVMAHA